MSRLALAARHDAEERFWSYVDRTGGASACWPWRGCTQKGYGLIGIDGRNHRAYRWFYELTIGQVPDGMELDHLCHTRDTACPGGHSCPHRRCVNPAHLEPVQRKVNILRGKAPSAVNARKTHCPQGHPLPEGRPRRHGAVVSLARRCSECARVLAKQLKHSNGKWQGGLPNYERTECPQGHPYDVENTIRERGRRICRACRRAKDQRRNARRGRALAINHQKTETRCSRT